MKDLLVYHFSQYVFLGILLVPAGIIVGIFQPGNPLPEWAEIIRDIFYASGALYCVYAFFWSRRAATLLTYENRMFTEALRDSRIQINLEISTVLCCMPIIGPLFSRLVDSEKKKDQQGFLKPPQEWDSNDKRK